MDTLSRTTSLLLLLAVVLGISAVAESPEKGRYERQTLAKTLAEPGVSYLLLDASDGTLLASRWGDPGRPVPVGSLVKPFTALAYAQSHAYAFPEHFCEGKGSCWVSSGHGTMDIVHAVAQSCNSYFVALAGEVHVPEVIALSRQFGLQGPAQDATPDVLAGRFGVWRELPIALARAYSELLKRRTQPGTRDITEGMLLSSRAGTGKAIGAALPRSSVYAKTGTAPCTHSPRAPGDGFALAAWPAELPRYVLLVRLHSAPGAQAAAVAGRAIHALERHP